MMADKYLEFEQDGKTYNLYEMPAGFVIKGHLNLSHQKLTELPDLSDVIVEGDFSCSKNSLTSLKGAPQKVGGNFFCISNKLTSLEGAPQKVGRDFCCWENQLTKLEGAPQEVGGDFACHRNQLTSLKGAPQKVGGDFKCNENFLTSLEGAPNEVGGDFFCTNNKLTSLEGAPQIVKGCFECFHNRLTSLLNIPEMQDEELIRCDPDMARKYGFDAEEFTKTITAKELYDSSAYQNEVKIEALRQVSRLREKTMQENAPKIAKTQAAFEVWLKQNGKETPEK